MTRALTLAGALILGLTLPTLVDAATATGLVNVRSGPGTSHPVIRIAWPGRPFTLHGCGKYWCKVSYGVTNGWMSAAHISK